MIPLLGPFTCHSCDMGSVFFFFGAVSFLESSALKITHQLLSMGYAFQPLGSLVGKALGQDLFWNGIIMTSSGQVATPLLTCTDGDSFSSQIQFFFSTQTSLTFSSMIVGLWPFNHQLIKLSLKISLNNLERRECDFLRGVWFLMPSQHRNFPNRYLTKSCPNLIQPFKFYLGEESLERDSKSCNWLADKKFELYLIIFIFQFNSLPGH